ncbi:MAG: hypothetical protein WC756_21200 [Taibaiella sp.]|jgi:hypothetical protein
MRTINPNATPPIIVGSTEERESLNTAYIVLDTKFIDYDNSVWFWDGTAWRESTSAKLRETTWLNRGDASDYEGQQIFISDVGEHGSTWHSRDGEWKRDAEVELIQHAKGWIVPSLAAADAATYSQTGTLITVTSTGHNIPELNYDTKDVYLNMGAAATGATIPPGWFSDFQRTGVNTFTCVSTTSQTGTGTVKTNIITVDADAIVIPELSFTIKGGMLANNGKIRYSLLGSNNNSAGIKNINFVFGNYSIPHSNTTTTLKHIIDYSISNRNKLNAQVLVYNSEPYVLAQDTSLDIPCVITLHVFAANDFIALHAASVYANPS